MAWLNYYLIAPLPCGNKSRWPVWLFYPKCQVRFTFDIKS